MNIVLDKEVSINLSAFEKLKKQLYSMFEMDKADLDFGIYRIINQKRDQISKFLDKDLLPQVQEELTKLQSIDITSIQDELNEITSQLEKLGADIDANPKVKELKAKLSDYSIEKTETEIYSDLYNFFKRYYDGGDFMSLRRYKEGVYAIPYEGEEVKLHWANHDQYYIKTTEDLKNYTFKLGSDNKKLVRFELLDADTEKDNNKAEKDKDRRFSIYEEKPLELISEDELIIYFEFKVNSTKQDALVQNALDTILSSEHLKQDWYSLLNAPKMKGDKKTILEKHIRSFVSKNSFDYFIHKDLGKFLRRELDFFIKNEIIHLDDIDSLDELKVESYLNKVKVLRKIAHKIIEFLAQIEEFQKKLWLKKKFVIETNYCVTLDKIFSRSDNDEKAKTLIPQILNNEQQIDEWIELFEIDDLESFTKPITEDFLRANDKLVLDTKFYSMEFKYQLLSIFENIDEECTGLLINSENFQALNLMADIYREKVDGVHIDPPYNTSTSGFLYKNQFKHSSWLSLMFDRLGSSINMISPNGHLLVHIDENEYENLFKLIKSFNLTNLGTMVWDKRNPMNDANGLALQHEYVIWFSKSKQIIKNSTDSLKSIFDKKDQLIKKYGAITEDLRRDFAKWINNNKELTGGQKAYSHIDDNGNIYRGVSLRAPEPRRDKKFFVPLVHPVSKKPCPVPPNGFSRTPDTLSQMKENGEIIFGEDESCQPQQKKILTMTSASQMTSVLQDAKKGKAPLDNLGLAFPYCHPPSFYEKLLHSIGKNYGHILDFFAGSGTTGHAVIDLNREDNGKRKFILVEMGKYFNTVLKPRIQKVIYSKDWKNGKPISREGVSAMFKYSSLESYEDTLNNLELETSHSQLALINQNEKLREEYMLSYMLDLESKESLLRIKDFADPFNYTLKIIEQNEILEKKVDLVETFNYLIGLHVYEITYDAKKRILYCSGKTNAGEKTLVIWRDQNKVDNDLLNETFSKRYSAKELEFDSIYVNGDNNLENLKLSDDKWKLKLIEQEFHRLMFDTSAVEAL